MPISKKYLNFLKLSVVGIFLLSVLPAFAAVEPTPMHWSGDKTLWNRKLNQVELLGHATVNQPGETMMADYILLDLNNRTLTAKGNCHYVKDDLIIDCEEMYIHLDSRTGTIMGGRVTNNSFLLVGDRINKLGERKFQTHKAQYTTCIDCPASWSFYSDDVDLEVEGYAHFSNVVAKVKDAPVLWSPYLIVPVKSERQTGFLFPRFGYSSSDGVSFQLPFFWAIHRSVDMTLTAGRLSSRGNLIYWEGRYALGERSDATINYYYNKDFKLDAPKQDRWGIKAVQRQKLFLGLEQKFKYQDVGDNLYPIHYPDNVPGRGEPVLASDLILSQSSSTVSGFVVARRYRNLLEFDHPTKFDGRTVQLTPKGVLTSNDQWIPGLPITGGLSLGVDRFTRSAGFFDYDGEVAPFSGAPYRPGIDPIRKATRANIHPSIYSPIRVFDVLSFIPSVHYYSYMYRFNDPRVANMSRGYLQTSADLSVQFEKVYETTDLEIPKIKHLVRPTLTYSRIPLIHEPSRHPFNAQVTYKNGYNFDSNDIVPLGSSPSLINYYVPQGHSISYGFTTQLIRRRENYKGSLRPVYQRTVELKGGQTFDIRELRVHPDQRVPFSRVYATSVFEFDHLLSNTQYYFYPYLSRLLPNVPASERSPHEISSSLAYIFEKGFHQNVLEFERSVGLSYTRRMLNSRTSTMGFAVKYSLSDYLLPSLTLSRNFLTSRFEEVRSTLTFQSASRCWKLDFNVGRTVDRGAYFDFNLTLNWTGSGFTGVGEIAEKGSG